MSLNLKFVDAYFTYLTVFNIKVNVKFMFFCFQFNIVKHIAICILYNLLI